MNYWKIIFTVFLTIILLSEGLGLSYGREVSFYLIILMPILLFLTDYISHEKVIFPFKITTLLFSFVLISIVSTFFSVDIQKSYQYLLFYISLILIFVQVFNHKEEVKKVIIKMLFILSVIFCSYSLLLLNLPEGLGFPMPDNGYQFVFSKFGSHNHLGDFLMLPLIISIYYLIKTNKKIYLLSLSFFTPFFILSYSRSAYLSLILTLVVMIFFLTNKFKISKITILLSFILILLASSFFFITVKEARKISIVKEANHFLFENLNLRWKNYDGQRLEYLNQAVSSIKEKPLFGLGPGNFIYASKEYGSKRAITHSSHNIFLDILTENGILAGVIFLTIIFLCLYLALRHQNLFSFLFIAQIINFQTDYTFTIYSFFLLFFVLVSVLYKE